MNTHTDRAPGRGLFARRILAGIVLAAAPAVQARFTPDLTARTGTSGLADPPGGLLLAGYYESFLKHQNVETFQSLVASRYSEQALARLVTSGDVAVRRGAVLALGEFGSYRVNGLVGHALRDPDPTVRALADRALWSIWFRADTAENNAALDRVRETIGRQDYETAVTLATRLIGRSPSFAEAYNQRAIAEFFLGRLRESAADCRRVVDRNPYHTGALTGLASCQVRLDEKGSALETLRRASRIQPYHVGIRQWIRALEAGEP